MEKNHNKCKVNEFQRSLLKKLNEDIDLDSIRMTEENTVLKQDLSGNNLSQPIPVHLPCKRIKNIYTVIEKQRTSVLIVLAERHLKYSV